MTIIESRDLTKTFAGGKIIALDNVSLSVDEGHIFGLLGPNGAGKTTLVKILLGILFPTSGSAELFGHPLKHIPSKERIGYLPENHNYPGFLKGDEVLLYYARLSGCSKNDIKGRIPNLLKLVNMEKWSNTKLKKYSKGMLQRLGLAQAMINDPDLLFLDEPTDGVDPIGRKEIRDVLLRLKEEGKTIFLNSHLLSEVEMICDEVAILDNGGLLRTGTVQELTTPKKIYRFETSAVGSEIIGEIRQQCLNLQVENGWLEVTIDEQTQLNTIIDALRQHQVDIRAVIPHKQSLEETFIKILKHEVDF